MIYWTVTVTVIPGKEEEAVKWMKKLAQYENEHVGTDIQLCQPMDGEGNRYVWVEKHESLAAWEECDRLFEADAGALAIRAEGEGLFSHSETHYWRTV